MSAPRTGTRLDDLLGPWIPDQRWYPAKGRQARTVPVGRLLLPLAAVGAPEAGAAEHGDVRVLVHLVQVVEAAAGAATAPREAEAPPVVQVPLVHRRYPREDDGAADALLGVLTDPDGSTWHVYDGPHDPAYVEALLSVLAGRVRAVGLGPDGTRREDAGSAAGDRPPGAEPAAPTSPARVLRGEQSNTSIIVDATGEDGAPAPVIVKVFRTLHPGRNPDVEVQAALSAAGVAAVPRLVGWVEGRWPAGGGALVHGDLAVASEFLAGAQDAWREATAAVAAGEDFSERASALGAATAQVHAALARELPSRAATEEDVDALAQGLRRRTEWALGAAPALAPHAGVLRAAVASLDLAPLPPLQRVHGDYHLGQVLHAPGRGWVLLDFEGEPLRPLAERTLPDLALRDVAGMLRSFDYAARQASVGVDDEAVLSGARAWAASARDAFCAGYAGAAGSDPREQGRLLDALELDKALYEVVYETRNRPDWLPVPLAAVERLVARAAPS